MAALRSFTKFQAPAERPPVQSMPTFRADDVWQPDVLHLSRTNDEREVQLVNRVHARVAAALGRAGENASPEAIRGMLAEQFPVALDEEHLSLNRTDRLRLQDAVLAEIVGYGPIQDLILDDSVSEIMVNGARQVWIEREGKLFLTDIVFADSDHVIRIIQRIVAPLGRRCDESSPMVDARLPDGSRVNAIIPPLSLVGPTLTIRKFRRAPLGPADLLRNNTVTPHAMQFLRACVQGRLNIVVAGGTGAGKTTLLNAISSFVSPRERIVTIEDAAEVRLQQMHVITLETRPANVEGRGEVSVRDLFRNALRMRPDRIVIGECRGPEALDMLQAMNTGHDGSLTTVHANGPRDALSRIETMVLMSGADLPLRAIRDQAVAALDLVIYIERLQDGTRRITQISEVRGLEGDVITMQDIFAFQREGFDGDRVLGSLRPTGIRPSFNDKLIARGIELPAGWFGYEAETGRLA
ncbi:MAG TPA: CpaF family protein [Candidatus Limnocylindria bacterium]|jgi:pilus assembly protein CpaF